MRGSSQIQSRGLKFSKDHLGVTSQKCQFSLQDYVCSELSTEDVPLESRRG